MWVAPEMCASSCGWNIEFIELRWSEAVVKEQLLITEDFRVSTKYQKRLEKETVRTAHRTPRKGGRGRKGLPPSSSLCLSLPITPT